MRTDPPEGGWASPEGIAELRRLCAKGSARNHNDRETLIAAMPAVLDALERAEANYTNACHRALDIAGERDEAQRIAVALAVAFSVVARVAGMSAEDVGLASADFEKALAWAADGRAAP